MVNSIAIAGQHQDHRTLELAGDINVFLPRSCTVAASRSRKGLPAWPFDCSRVASLDVAADQILVALKETLVARGEPMGVSGLSRELMETIRSAGLGEQLGLGSGSVRKGDTE